MRPRFAWSLTNRSLELGRRTLIMGVLNVTPDSFFDGGRHYESHRAVDQALGLIEAGADILDIGGESTRPRSSGAPAGVEEDRVLPVLEALRGRTGVPVSIDTKKAQVARAALDAGAEIINDITAMRADPAMIPLAAQTGCGVVLMHMRGAPADMQSHAVYADLIGEIRAEMLQAAKACQAGGVAAEKIVLDPGIGFAKKPVQNQALVGRMAELADLGYPLLVGPSRKSFIGAALAGAGLSDQPDDRLFGTVAAVSLLTAAGAHIVRVHDVAAVRQALAVCDAVAEATAQLNFEEAARA